MEFNKHLFDIKYNIHRVGYSKSHNTLYIFFSFFPCSVCSVLRSKQGCFANDENANAHFGFRILNDDLVSTFQVTLFVDGINIKIICSFSVDVNNRGRS